MEDEDVSFRGVFQFQWLTKELVVHLRASVEILSRLDMSAFVLVRVPAVDDVQVFDFGRIGVVQEINHLDESDAGCRRREGRWAWTYRLWTDAREIGMFATFTSRQKVCARTITDEIPVGAEFDRGFDLLFARLGHASR